MRENISYAKCTCDVCGDVKHIAQSRCFPDGWGEITFPMGDKLEVCDQCLLKIREAISRLKNKQNQNASSYSGCIHNGVETDWDFCK